MPDRAGGALVNELVLRASATSVQGTGAIVQLRYRGVVIADGEVSSSTLTDLVFRVAGSFSGNVLDLVFTNAGINGLPARRLTVEGIYVNGTRLSPTAPGVTYDRGYGQEAFDGIGVSSGSSVLTETGALRIPLPTAAQLGAPVNSATAVPSRAPGPYVDVWFGTDSNPGTAARPYRTLAALRGRTLLAGENIFLRCGNLWRETLALGVSELSNGTEIRRYGDDCATTGNPVVSGADAFNGGWTRNGNVWSRALPPGTPQITQLFVGYTAMRPAQWPNADAPLVVADAATASQPNGVRISAAAASALAGKNLAGATALVRTTAWNIEQLQVAGQGLQGQDLRLVAAPRFPIKPGDSLVLRDQAWMLDAPGEYFHDVAGQRLFLIAANTDAGLDLNAANVEGSVRDVAIDLRERSGVVVSQISVRLARQDGIRMTNAPQARLEAIESRENGAAGVRLMQWSAVPAGTPGPTIQDSLFAGNGEHGIEATFVSKAAILNNRVLDTGLGVRTGTSFAGISAGPGATVDGNEITGSAYAGIMFSSLAGSLITRNEVSRYCVRLSDCGGLYTWTAESAVSTEQRSVIQDNRVHAANANINGSGGWSNDVVAGIYLDEFTQGATVRNNFLQGMATGILLHNAAKVTVESNRIWLAQRSALWVTMSRTDADWSTGNLLRNNEILPMVTASGTWPNLPSFVVSHPVWFSHSQAGVAALAPGRNEFVANRVIQINGVVGEHALIAGPEGQGQRFVDAAGWRDINPQEALPERPITFLSYFLDLGPEKVVGGQFSSGLAPWTRYWNWQLPSSVADLQFVLSQPGCSGPCMRLTTAQQDESIFSPAFSLNPGVPHLYRWTAVAAQAKATVGTPYISTANSPWSPIHDSRGFVTLGSREVKAGQRLQYEAFFVPTTGTSARVNLQLETTGVPIHFDDVSVREIRGWWLAGPPQWVATVVAPRNQPRVVNSCAEFGWPAQCRLLDRLGAPVTLPVTVNAGDAMLLLWADSPYRQVGAS